MSLTFWSLEFLNVFVNFFMNTCWAVRRLEGLHCSLYRLINWAPNLHNQLLIKYSIRWILVKLAWKFRPFRTYLISLGRIFFSIHFHSRGLGISVYAFNFNCPTCSLESKTFIDFMKCFWNDNEWKWFVMI